MAGQVQQALVDAGLCYHPNGHQTQLVDAGVCLLITYGESLPKEGLSLCVLQEKNENLIWSRSDPIEIIYHSLAFLFLMTSDLPPLL